MCEVDGGGANLSCFCVDVAAFACMWLNSVSSTSVSFGEGCMYFLGVKIVYMRV